MTKATLDPEPCGLSRGPRHHFPAWGASCTMPCGHRWAADGLQARSGLALLSPEKLGACLLVGAQTIVAECVMGKIFFTSHSPVPKSWPGTSVPQCVHRDGSFKVERLPGPAGAKQAWHLLCAGW